MTDWDSVEVVASRACGPFRRAFDHEDLLQEARLVAWQQRDTPQGLAVTIARRRVIDRMRAADGRRPERRPRIERMPLHGTDEGSRLDLAWSAVDDVDPVLELGLSGRDAVIAEGLAAGTPRQDIAEDVGVSPGRVTQLVAKLREKV